MKATVRIAAALLVAWGLAWPGSVGAQSPPDVAGVFGIQTAAGQAWLAFRVAVPADSALAGVVWYNNDENITFPRVLVGTGYPANPGDLAEFTEIASEVAGGSSAWSEVAFDLPVAASLEAVYVAFELPATVPLAGRGMGGGPGVGYVAGGTGCAGWLSGDGELWARLHEDYRFAVVPKLIVREPGMLVKSLGDGKPDGEVPEAVVDVNYLRSAPNPFNPRTTLRFGLTREQQVRVDVYDLKGRRVVRLFDDVLPRGHHSIEWLGRDAQGRNVASGVYFARLIGHDVELTERLTLVR